jgi:hypothetical protein
MVSPVSWAGITASYAGAPRSLQLGEGMNVIDALRRAMRSAWRLVRMPPDYAALRLQAEIWRRLARHPAGWWERRYDKRRLLCCLAQTDMATLDHCIATQRAPYNTAYPDRELYDDLVPGHTRVVIEQAENVLQGWVCVLGSGPVNLGTISWHRDYTSGLSWPLHHYAAIDAADLDRSSDVKFPWELSRLQWLIPVGQAYRLTGDERYATFVRDTLESWMEANPCAWGVNWACTMEPAMRVFTWTWLYRMFGESRSWNDESFRFRVLRTLYLHLLFVRHNLEITDINGNHLTADAAALVVGGTFFGTGTPIRWMTTGWKILRREIELQVLPDGVDFEASTAYHRLVTELFHHAAASLEEAGTAIPRPYIHKLLLMAGYIRAYTKPDGSAPVIGDADDARTLPLGQQDINDHRYLPQLIRARWAPEMLTADWRQSASECLWWWGKPPTDADNRAPAEVASNLFTDGGSAIIHAGTDYVFIDCGPVGLGGRGGHGHNDCLSFEAVLKGHSLVTDPGCLVYSGDWRTRNLFRSTAVHNTPRLGEEEINRFVSPKDLWSLHDDARGKVEVWEGGPFWVLFRGSHGGYRRLDRAATVTRSLVLDKSRHALAWEDKVVGAAGLIMRVPLQLAPGLWVIRRESSWIGLLAGTEDFVLEWSPDVAWKMTVEPGAVAPSYGIRLDAPRLVWAANSAETRRIRVFLYPGTTPNNAIRSCLEQAIDQI